MNRVQVLRALQDTDQEWDEKGRRYQLVRKLLTDTSELDRIRATWQQTQHDLARNRADLKNIELEMASLQAKQQEVQDGLYGGRIRNPKDLETLQKESAILKQRLSHLEDTALSLMSSVDELEQKERDEGTAFSEADHKAAADQISLNQEYAVLRARLQELLERREKLRGALVGTDLALYDDLRIKKSGTVLAPMLESSCQVCRVSVPSRKASLAVSGDEIVLCEGCGRILFSA